MVRDGKPRTSEWTPRWSLLPPGCKGTGFPPTRRAVSRAQELVDRRCAASTLIVDLLELLQRRGILE